MDRLIDGQQVTAKGRGRVGSGGIEEKGLMDVDNSVVVAGRSRV